LVFAIIIIIIMFHPLGIHSQIEQFRPSLGQDIAMGDFPSHYAPSCHASWGKRISRRPQKIILLFFRFCFFFADVDALDFFEADICAKNQTCLGSRAFSKMTRLRQKFT
jgi:hypothetical protein